MDISERTINALGKIITGDGGITPYRSGPVLVRLFNEFGRDDVYGQGFPSRWQYAEECIRFLKQADGNALCGLIQTVFDPREFLGTDHNIDEVVVYINSMYT